MTSPETVLLVEDDLIDVMSIRRVFRDLALDNPLVVVANAEQALVFLRDPAQPRPGLILLDLNMPRMNGLEFLAVVPMALFPAIALPLHAATSAFGFLATGLKYHFRRLRARRPAGPSGEDAGETERMIE